MHFLLGALRVSKHCWRTPSSFAMCNHYPRLSTWARGGGGVEGVQGKWLPVQMTDALSVAEMSVLLFAILNRMAIIID